MNSDYDPLPRFEAENPLTVHIEEILNLIAKPDWALLSPSQQDCWTSQLRELRQQLNSTEY